VSRRATVSDCDHSAVGAPSSIVATSRRILSRSREGRAKAGQGRSRLTREPLISRLGTILRRER
jgi:hypothetical protein